ncbi:MAG TPA: hypothetical protein VER17_18430 [Tepidisphaeraceae bacterium]|nr:hypothetical protein [Tepidisphaeraceae bacterium]
MTDETHEGGGWRWGWILLLGAVALFVLLFGGHWLWTAGSAKQLARHVALIKSSGEPIEPADFRVAPVPDADNAAIDIRAAVRSVDTASEAWKAYDRLSPRLPLTEKEIAALRALVADNAAAFASIDAAMTRKGIDWQINLKSPVIAVLLPDLNGQRMLANVVAARAMLAYTDGDHAAALADVRRLRFLSRALETQPMIVSHLVSNGVDAMAVAAVARMTPGLKIDSGKGDVPPQQVAELIAALLDDAPQRRGLKRALQSERMAQLDTARCVADGTLSLASLSAGGIGGGGGAPGGGAAVINFAVRPIALADGALMIDHTSKVIRAAEAALDAPTFVQSAPPVPPQIMSAPFRHVLARIMLPSFERAIQTDFRVMTERRLAAVALALRWYAIDHGGKLPEKLEDLVPKYLPTVPADPMQAGGKLLKYVPNPAKPILYSVGDNAVDDGGSEASATNRPAHGIWQQLDAVRPLTPQPREIFPGEEDEEAEAPATAPATASPAAADPVD